MHSLAFKSMAVAAAVAISCSSTAVASITMPADASLTLTLRDGGRPDGPLLGRVTLNCGPDGGTHPEPRAACAAIERVQGNLADLPKTNGVCAMVSAPVIAEATGTWRHTPVSFERTYPNRCVAATDSNDVFKF